MGSNRTAGALSPYEMLLSNRYPVAIIDATLKPGNISSFFNLEREHSTNETLP